MWRTAVGYQSVGMRPIGVVFAAVPAPSETSNTATALLSASATNSFDPSGDNVIAFGVLPSEGPAGAASLRRWETLFAFVSTTAISSDPANATNKCVPDLFDAIADGCRPTFMLPDVFNFPSLCILKTATVSAPHADTQTFPSAAISIPYG